MIKLTQ